MIDHPSSLIWAPKRAARTTVTAMVAVIVAIASAGCGDNSDDGGSAGSERSATTSPETPAVSGGAGSPSGETGRLCPDADHVSDVLELEFHLNETSTRENGDAADCQYENPDGSFVGLAIGPASNRDAAVESMRKAAVAMLGTGTELEEVALGDGAHVWASRSLIEVSAVADDRLYYARFSRFDNADFSHMKDGMVELTRSVMRD